jgi:hypothetical protein
MTQRPAAFALKLLRLSLRTALMVAALFSIGMIGIVLLAGLSPDGPSAWRSWPSDLLVVTALACGPLAVGLLLSASYARTRAALIGRVLAGISALVWAFAGSPLATQVQVALDRPAMLAYLINPKTSPCPAKSCIAGAMPGQMAFLRFSLIDNFVGVCVDPTGALARLREGERPVMFGSTITRADRLDDQFFACAGT